MVLDLESFCADLRQAESQKSVDAAAVSPYLMQTLFVPYMLGKTVMLDSLDYDAFDLDDLTDLLAYVDEACGVGDVLGVMFSSLHQCDPSARQKRGFC